MEFFIKKRVPLKNKFNFIILDIKDGSILAVPSFKGRLKFWNLLSLVDDVFQILERRRFKSKVARWYKHFGIRNIEEPNFPRTSHLFPPDMHTYVRVRIGKLALLSLGKNFAPLSDGWSFQKTTVFLPDSCFHTFYPKLQKLDRDRVY